MPLTVKIVVGLDTSIGQSLSVHSDISYGITDGVDFQGFQYADQNDYPSQSACSGKLGKSGDALSGDTNGPLGPPFTKKMYPGQAVITLKPTEQWGSCYTTHDGGFLNYMNFNSHLDLSKGIFFEVYKTDKSERVGIKFLEVSVI